MSVEKAEGGSFWEEADVISRYTRLQAIEDGVLVDVSETAKEAGFKWPVAITSNLLYRYIEPSKKAKENGQDLQGRLWDVLWMNRLAAKRAKRGGEKIIFEVLFRDGPRKKHIVKLISVIGPGDQGEPVITIMLQEDQ